MIQLSKPATTRRGPPGAVDGFRKVPLSPGQMHGRGVSFASTNPTMFSGLALKSTVNRQSPADRLQRSRERNRMHARKTRQRKKEHIHLLQARADALKDEQLKIRQLINEKNTASILVGLFSAEKDATAKVEDPKIDELLLRTVEEIPDASKVPTLPALILPGQHKARKRAKESASTPESADFALPLDESFPDDDIDYQLLGKDRAKCSPAELDQIRRERNRMHAKRTRERKRIFMEEMGKVIKQLENENDLLHSHYVNIGGAPIERVTAEDTTPLLSSPALGASQPAPSQYITTSSAMLGTAMIEKGNSFRPDRSQVTADQIKSLLLAAGTFEQREPLLSQSLGAEPSAVSAATSSNSSEHSIISDQDDEGSLSSAPKRQRLDDDRSAASGGPPMSITTNQSAIVGC